ncbi:MAG: nuclear transport factor 2 family protein [Acidimicrobiales bacterium]
MTADAAIIRATVDAYCAAVTAGDRAAYIGLFTEDGWLEDPVGTPRIVGHEGIGAFFDQSQGMADSIALRRTGPVRAAAGECAFPIQARPEIGGATFVVDIIDVMTFADDGRITTMRAFWDAADTRPADD